MDIDRLMQILSDWARHCKNYNPARKLGYPTHSMALVSGGESTSDVFETMCAEADMHNVKAIDALIDGLHENQAQSIRARFLGEKKPMFYETHLRFATEALIKLCNKRNIV
jgi:hypothetical protein